MRILVGPASVMIVLCLFASACDTRNVGTKLQPDTGPKITSFTVTPSDPAGLFGGEQAIFKVEWEGGTAPYSLDLLFGGAAEPDIMHTLAVTPYVLSVAILQPNTFSQEFTASVLVTDSNGLHDTAQLSLHVMSGEIYSPSIDAIDIEGNKVTVTTSDPLANDLTVTLDSVTDGLSGTPASAPILGGNGRAEFTFTANDVFAGAAGTATFSVANDDGGSDTDTSGVIYIPPLDLADDSLGAIPRLSRATVGDTVKVVVATGRLNHAFQFMTGVSVVFPPGCVYEAQSYDYGAPAIGDSALNPSASKDQETVDGIWTVVNPASGFIGVGDNLLVPDPDLPAPFIGSSAIDFNITPLGGSDAPAGTSGMLFNFNLEFTAPGSYKLGFLLFDEINRTYYQDGSQAAFAWTDLSNNNEYSTVEVTP